MTDKQAQSVDAILTGKEVDYKSSSEPGTPEQKEIEVSAPEPEAASEPAEPITDDTGDTTDTADTADTHSAPVDDNVDEYGNPKQTDRMYTQDELNERINKAVRERLDRLNKNADTQSPQAQQEINQAQQDFQYNEDEAGNWEQQLENFIYDRLDKKQRLDAQKQQQQQEQARQAEFEDKFRRGMTRFDDFADVVGKQRITDAMVMGTRGMNDPASFLYAASKHHAQELQQISQLADPMQQVAAMGRLETKMKSARRQTNAPEPVSRTSESRQTVGDRSIDSLINAHGKQKAKRRGIL